MTRLYIMRHAQAADGEVDSLRPLSERGRLDAASIGARLAAASVKPDIVVHSGLVRAEQTADLVAAAIGVLATARPGLAPGDGARVAARWLVSQEGDTCVVSHQPLVGGVISMLLGGEEDDDLAVMKTGQVVALERSGSRWAIVWSISPASP